MGFGQHEVKARSTEGYTIGGAQGTEFVLGLDILFIPHVSGRTSSEGVPQLRSNNNVGFTTMPPCRPATSNCSGGTWGCPILVTQECLSMAHMGRASLPELYGAENDSSSHDELLSHSHWAKPSDR